MTTLEAMLARHSVRAYRDTPIDLDALARLSAEVVQCNTEGKLHLQLITDEPNAFGGFMAHYGKFFGVRNYLALVGKKSADLDERLGWYGERIVLLAQQLGINSCWVGLSFSRGAAKKSLRIEKGEELRAVIALGYGETQGVEHESRPLRECCRADGVMPEWFGRGMKAAMLAPTAINQQRFRFTLLPDGSVEAKSLGGPCSHIDLGIVSYHFLLGAGEESFRWAK